MARRKLAPHTYQPDRSTPGQRRGDPPLCRCGLPKRHERHPDPDPDQTSEAAAYEARRLGEREE